MRSDHRASAIVKPCYMSTSSVENYHPGETCSANIFYSYKELLKNHCPLSRSQSSCAIIVNCKRDVRSVVLHMKWPIFYKQEKFTFIIMREKKTLILEGKKLFNKSYANVTCN